MSHLTSTGRIDLVRSLKWQLAMGADAAVLNIAVDRTQAQQPDVSSLDIKPQPVSASPLTQPGSQISSCIDVTQINNSQTLKGLRGIIENFNESSLKATALQTVFGEGPAPADVMVIGEAPGREEDETGRPFVGASGQLLDEMLTAAGLPRFEISYITNILPWRPPGNRTPSDDEVQTFLPFCLRHIELVQPKFIIALGGVSAKALLGLTAGITRSRGKPLPIAHHIQFKDSDRSSDVPVMPTFHPAYLLRNPEAKRAVWRDLLETRLMLEHFTASLKQ